MVVIGMPVSVLGPTTSVAPSPTSSVDESGSPSPSPALWKHLQTTTASIRELSLPVELILGMLAFVHRPMTQEIASPAAEDNMQSVIVALALIVSAAVSSPTELGPQTGA